jgi:acetyltransferase-like isoleucine patch superfamily enzyme
MGDTSYYAESELRGLGLRDYGERVRLSRKASIYGASSIALGSDVRIDDFCVIGSGEGGIQIGSFVHIAVFCSLLGRARIVLEDFSGLSSRVAIYSSSDNYSGEKLTNPTVPAELSGTQHAEVIVGRHVIIGAGSVLLPGAVLEEGAAVGALSLIRSRCQAFGVYFGSPARKIGERKRDLLALEERARAASRRRP